MSHFFQNRPPNHPKNLTDLFWPHKDLEIPLTKTFLGSKTPWNPPVIPSLTAWDPPRSLTKHKDQTTGFEISYYPHKNPNIPQSPQKLLPRSPQHPPRPLEIPLTFLENLVRGGPGGKPLKGKPVFEKIMTFWENSDLKKNHCKLGAYKLRKFWSWTSPKKVHYIFPKKGRGGGVKGRSDFLLKIIHFGEYRPL